MKTAEQNLNANEIIANGEEEILSVKRKSSDPFIIPWEDGKPFKLSIERLENLILESKNEKYEKSYFHPRDLSFDLCENILSLEAYCGSVFQIHFLIEKDGVFVQCDCKCKGNVCLHLWSSLRYCLWWYGETFFKQFYLPEIRDLALEHRRLLAVDTTFDGIQFKPKEGYGRVFGFKNERELLFRFSSPVVKKKSLPDSHKKIIFGIPDDAYNFQQPILIPYLATPNPRHGSKRPFIKYDKSFLLQNSSEEKPKNLTKNQRAINTICEEMLIIANLSLEKLSINFEDGESDEHLDEDKLIISYRNKLLFELWQEVIPLLSSEFVLAFHSALKDSSLIRPVTLPSFRVSLCLLHPIISFLLIYNEGVIKFRMQIKIANKFIENPSVFPSSSGFFISTEDKGKYTLVNKAHDAELISRFSKIDYCITVLPNDYVQFKGEILDKVAVHYPIFCENRDANDKFFEVRNILNCLKKKVMFTIKGDTLLIAFNLVYDCDVIIDAFTDGNSIFGWQGSYEKVFLRNKESEDNERNIFLSCNEDFQRQVPFGVFRLPVEKVKHGSWLADTVKLFTEENYEIDGLENLVGFHFNPYPMKWDMKIYKKTNHVEIALEICFGDQRIGLDDIRDCLASTMEIIQLPDGSVGRIPREFKQRILPLMAVATKTKNGLLQISLQHFTSIQSFANKITDKQLHEQLKLQRKKLQQLDKIQPLPKPEKVQAVLRPYQETGFSWMGFLREFGWGGVLADDMGLGKTLQILTVLEYHYIQSPDSPASLIVVPNSLLFNWQAEVKKFTPHRKVLVHHGVNRSLMEVSTFPGQLLLTTYGTLISDIELLSKEKFGYLILDESQSIKNPQSKRFECVQAVRSDFRLALTGTPIENGISDLFAQLDFVNPGFLGTYGQFKRNFPGIADGTASVETKESLQQLIAPFMLRRTKAQVAKDLPEKTEMTLYCEMLPEQRKVYEQYRRRFRSELEDKMDERKDQATMFVLEALMKLRQICNSPALIPNEKYENHSAKLEEIREHILEKTQGHKLLIFSSFTKMLALLEDELKSVGIGYAYLDGKTSGDQRQQAVNRFQEESDCRVFLISLKAGGTGLNLTAADYVYIFDPWWNPAAEAQAIDRCYRIGQDKHVMAYRMVCKDSIEERILQLQEGKKALAETLVQTDSSVLKSLNKEQLLKLFE
ncbi:DEAD/DEAH box helicase [Olivibacter domesticus]|uniref:Helicase conserved C-terminal domain-containing protein n=1 Tax=Olivibacter domesticus TaxID=407022 RepID=A0A1H7SFQ6_OLID1|nr:DEAD/DEAH box helicase [Olivibacter domesticus]SEL71149.1 Helicase conserved C-terminal domain-containing protein [Olivibacter domesticus]